MRTLILSGKDALQKQIGSVKQLEKHILAYIRDKHEYNMKFIYYDRANQFKIAKSPKKPSFIRQFIQKIEEKWGFIDFLLILGGDEVIPFFRLKNPCDDDDKEIISDSPYASRDDDYLIPERACARIPDNQDSEFMIDQMKSRSKITKKSFGITAKIWRKVSKNVYEKIGNTKELRISPPVNNNTFKNQWLKEKDYLYFNLHGSKTTAKWYGQENEHFPVALDMNNIEHARGMVGCEACYGAYIFKKSHKNSLALRLLKERNVYCFCGSTTIAYGPIVPPPGEADLMIGLFFEHTKKGMTIGESFKQAKIDFARKVIQRQGFLDDDDQKTLLQFVLYGDPTFRLEDRNLRQRVGS